MEADIYFWLFMAGVLTGPVVLLACLCWAVYTIGDT